MNKGLRVVARTIAAGLLGCTSMQAIAQDDTAAAAPQDDIVVTALRRGQSLQRVPAAVSALSGADLQQRGLSNVEDIATAVPNLNFGEHDGTTLITIRGVGSTVDSGVTEPTVATYVDGVFLPRATMALLRAVDLERLEVLRGPQGTLYGRNATGGAINFISQAPTDSVTGQVNLSAGSRGAFGASGYVSGPLAEGVLLRVSGGHEEDDGFVRLLPGKGRLGNTNVDYVRGALRLEPASTVSVDLSVRYEKSTGRNAYQQLLTPTILPTPQQTTQVNRLFSDAPFRQDVDTLVAAGAINWELSDAVTLKSITSFVDHHSHVSFDADSTGVDFFSALDFSRPSRSYGQEVTLSGDTPAVKWIVGAYYFHERAGNALPLYIGSALAPGFGVPAGTLFVQSVDTRTRSIALFGDVTWSVSDRLRLNLGLRYNHERKRFAQDLFLELPVPLTVPIATGVPARVSYERVLPKVNLQYDLAPDALLYAQWSRGFKSGGQNLPGGAGENLGAAGLYAPEEIDAFEVGLKTQFADRRVTLNLAAFYYDYSDLQVTITVPPATTLVQNAPAKIYGIEAEFGYRVNDAFRIDASANVLHARFRDFLSFDDAQPALGTQNLRGEALPHAPNFTFNGGAQYRIDLGSGLISSLTLRGDVNYSSKVVLRYFGTANDVQDDYWLGNLSATFADADDKTQLRLFVKNVGDSHYLQNVTYIGAVGAYMGNYAQPRTWGVELSRKF